MELLSVLVRTSFTFVSFVVFCKNSHILRKISESGLREMAKLD